MWPSQSSYRPKNRPRGAVGGVRQHSEKLEPFERYRARWDPGRAGCPAPADWPPVPVVAFAAEVGIVANEIANDVLVLVAQAWPRQVVEAVYLVNFEDGPRQARRAASGAVHQVGVEATPRPGQRIRQVYWQPCRSK